MRILTAALLIVLTFHACKKENTDKEKPVAKVIDKYLYLKEIKDVIPNNSSKEDSIILANSYINQWITKQLLLHKAEINLTEEEKNISKLIDDYRTSLLIYRYKQKLLEQKLKIGINEVDLEEYYNKYKFNFTLNHNIVKALYIKLPKNAPGLKRLKKLYKSEKAKDMEELEEYCLLNAKKFDTFNNTWIPAETLLSRLPIKINNKEKYLKKTSHIEEEDEEYIYFVKIKDFKLRNSIAPFEYVEDDVKEILKNKRKIEFESQLEKELNQDAKSKNLFIIY